MEAYEIQLERLKQALNVNSDTAFSEVLEVSQGSVSGAKKRGQIPHAWFFFVSKKTGYSLNWLFFGEGPMLRSEAGTQQRPQNIASPTPVQKDELCPRCVELEAELKEERKERRELNSENRRLWAKNEQILSELSDIKEENATLRARCGLLEKENGQSRPNFQSLAG